MTGSIEGVERFDSPGRGRGLRVTRAFKVGELLFSCQAYSYVLSAKERGFYCECCFTRKEGLARCGKCRKACYCNVKCQKADWAMHKLECSAMTAFGENWCPSEMTRLVARILAKKKAQKERSASEKILLIGDMQSHVEDVDNEKREMHEGDVAALHRFYSKHLELPDHKDLLTLFSQVACNGFTVEDDELSHMGTAVYPDVALINHSCLPSVIVTYNGTSADVRAVRDMKPGDESKHVLEVVSDKPLQVAVSINNMMPSSYHDLYPASEPMRPLSTVSKVLISYIDLLYPTDDRNNRLRESYYFTCDCQECKSKSKDKVKLKVRKRSEPIDPEVVNNMVRYARKTIREFRFLKNTKTPSELLEMCELSLEEMGAVFADSNVYMLHMMYQAMGVCLYMEDPVGAIRYGEKVVGSYSKLYPAHSLNVSSMYLKLGRLNMGLERNSVGISALKKAIAIMEVTHGKNHFYLKELRKEAKLTKN